MNGWPKSVTRALVALLLVAGSFYIYYLVSSGACDVQWKDIVNIIIGAVIANLTTLVQYYFGSSTGSEQKTEIMARALEKINP